MYTVIDFETTGLDHTENVVIEIGAIKLDKNLRDYASFNTKVTLPPGVELPELITKITKITPESLVDAMHEDEAFELLWKFIADDIVIAHNAPFDLGFLAKYRPHYKPNFLDTRTIIKLIEPGEKASLKDAVKRYSVPYLNHHSALADCVMTAGVLRGLRDKVGSVDKLHDYLNTAVDSEERPLRYKADYMKVITQ